MKKHLHNSLRVLFLSLAVFLSLPMLAEKIEIDGIWYDLDAETKQATVIKKSSGKYSGEVVIPETVEFKRTAHSVTSIGGYAFDFCYNLTSVTIPNSVTSIGWYAFNDCDDLTSVTIPNSVTSIGGYAFNDCDDLTSVTIPNSVTSIGGYAFSGCSGLTSVTIPNSVTSIEWCAFSGCSSLTTVTIPNSVTSIERGAFSGCSSLTTVTIPNSVTSIGGYAFSGCSGLTSVTIPNSVTGIAYEAFAGCSGLTSVTIPNSVTGIGESAFCGCSGLTSVTIPNSVTYIGLNAFGSCSGLTSVTIPNSVTTIEEWAFLDCPELLDVYCYAEKVPSTKSNAFDGSYPDYVTLHVPDASIDSYKATVPWSGFGKIVGLSGEEPQMEKCATPVVSYADGKLSMACETEGAEFITKVMSDDITTYYDAEIEFSATYNIEVYATKSGYDNSDTISVALVWIENGDVSENTGVISVESTPVLITCCNGTINVCGGKDGTKVAVYTTSGVAVGNTTIINGNAVINTSLTKGDIAIVNIAGKGIKVVMQ